MSAPARLSRADFIARVSAAVRDGTGFAAGKIGLSEQFLLYHPILEANYPDPRRRRAAEVALAYHGVRQTGIFPETPAFQHRFLDFYVPILRRLDALGLVGGPAESAILRHYRLEMPVMDFIDQEPGRASPDDPADCYLPAFRGKRVLIVSPFAPLLVERARPGTFEAVWAKTGKRWFHPAEVTGMTMPYGWDPAIRRRFGDSLALFEHLAGEMAGQAFDVALIAAGGLSIPLAVHARSLGAVGISLGGHLQVLFGVLGARWRDDPEWRARYINEAWVDLPAPLRPAGPVEMLVDGGAYW